MSSMSLTPRETSSGLRRPRLAAPAKSQPLVNAAALVPVPPEHPAHDRAESDMPPMPSFLRALPTQEAIRKSVRSLKERRVVSLTDNNPQDVLSAIIRSGTALTLKQAHSEPGGADLTMAREAELERQRTRLEDLRRTYDLLHAEYIGKEEVRLSSLLQPTPRRFPTLRPAARWGVPPASLHGGRRVLRQPPSRARSSSCSCPPSSSPDHRRSERTSSSS